MVSVAIPTYNQEKYIAETINSVLAQKTDFDYEIVVGEDCSRDGTRAILENIQCHYPNKVRVILNEKNLGLVLNVNRMLDNCRGKYIALLGGDDFFSSEHKLQKQADFLESNENYGLVHSDAKLVVEGTGDSMIYESADRYLNRRVKTGDVFDNLLVSNFIIASTAFFRKDLYDKYVNLELYAKKNFLMEDYPMWLELAKRGKFAYLSDPLTTYRFLPSSLCRPKDLKKKYAFRKSEFAVRVYFIRKYDCGLSTKTKVYFNMLKQNIKMTCNC